MRYGGSEGALVAAPVAARVHLALAGYFYAYIPILFGIVVLAAGLGHAVSHIADPLFRFAQLIARTRSDAS